MPIWLSINITCSKFDLSKFSVYGNGPSVAVAENKSKIWKANGGRTMETRGDKSAYGSGALEWGLLN